MLREQLARGKPVFGTFCFIPAPSVVEIVGLAGFDFVIVDMEHTPLSLETVEDMVRAAELRGLASLVRVPVNDPKFIQRTLETGAEGVVVPFLQSAEDAKRAAEATRYPPLGIRGTCTVSRASMYGSVRHDYAEHTKKTNARILLVGLLEDRLAAQNITEMVAVSPGPDVFFIGRSDLASSMGLIGGANHEMVIRATEEMVDAVARGGKIPGIVIYRPEEVDLWYTRGCRFFVYSTDNLVLLSAYKGAVEAFQRSLSTLEV